MEPTTRILEIDSTQKLGYAIYGDPEGYPVYYMHGFYGSRLEAQLAAAAAEKCGIQLIAADRPGVGKSTSEAGRSLDSWASRIEKLADHLGHDRFHVLGVSGGGPFALATARQLGHRVTGLALCGSLAPWIDRRILPGNYRIALWANYSCRPLLKMVNLALYCGARRTPGLLIRTIALKLSPADKRILKEATTKEILRASLSAAAAQGPRYGDEELAIFGSNWSSLLTDLSSPIDIWHGSADHVVPVAMAHQLKAGLPQATLHIIPAAGHFSLPIEHAEKIFDCLTGSSLPG